MGQGLGYRQRATRSPYSIPPTRDLSGASSFRTLSGRLKFTVRRHKFASPSLSPYCGNTGGVSGGDGGSKNQRGEGSGRLWDARHHHQPETA